MPEGKPKPDVALIEFTNRGLYCAQADVYIDPWKPVDKALITHGHADHARFGHKSYCAHRLTVPIMRLRLGENPYQSVEYGEKISLNGVHISFHPAGHIPGSAQIRLEHKGEVWVVSGDYKLEADGLSAPFEPIRCHHFITESTFGLPIYKWIPQSEVFADINQWWQANAHEQCTSIVLGYTLGKAQRILKNVGPSLGPLFAHGSIQNMNDALRQAGVALPHTQKASQGTKEELRRALVIAPPSATATSWLKRFPRHSLAVASGWMALRGAKRRRAADKGFVLSDHADWPGLNEAVKLSGAECAYITHGYTAQFAQWLNEQGTTARVVETLFAGEEGKVNPALDQESAADREEATE